MDFTEIEEDKLINLVIKYPALYDSAHKDYLNTVTKDNIWKVIGTKMNKTSEDCRKKWRIVRDTYARFKKRCKVGTGGGAASKQAKHKRYKKLTFLDSVRPHRSVGSKTSPSPKKEEIDINVDINDQFESEEQETIFNNTDEQILYGLLAPNEEGDEEMFNNEETRVKKESEEEEMYNEEATRVKKESEDNDTENWINNNEENNTKIFELWQQRDANMQNLIKMIAQKKDDDVDYFCRHIAEVLRKLPPLDRAKAKKHLSGILSDYEILALS